MADLLQNLRLNQSLFVVRVASHIRMVKGGDQL
jgi:hypothetical protein